MLTCRGGGDADRPSQSRWSSTSRDFFQSRRTRGAVQRAKRTRPQTVARPQRVRLMPNWIDQDRCRAGVEHGHRPVDEKYDGTSSSPRPFRWISWSRWVGTQSSPADHLACGRRFSRAPPRPGSTSRRPWPFDHARRPPRCCADMGSLALHGMPAYRRSARSRRVRSPSGDSRGGSRQRPGVREAAHVPEQNTSARTPHRLQTVTEAVDRFDRVEEVGEIADDRRDSQHEPQCRPWDAFAHDGGHVAAPMGK